ncbi:hypothetical protein PISMIDRAFT_18357 [Pisolithus microcarpus 441]|uniref:Uncharacterized protein n=1 Tax=Pisolithus microcarpus 441 TaxID=765257 RepID=A0A0C9Y7N7_9AGAM|nr:hypothetical protein PISMIDRAFT_18357 [Pisolithus microcarpus 441]
MARGIVQTSYMKLKLVQVQRKYKVTHDEWLNSSTKDFEEVIFCDYNEKFYV